MLRICDMATPTRCTSLGPRWRNTCAASVWPRDSRRIAALSTLFSFAGALASLISVNPLFHDLGPTAWVFCHQALDGVQLCIIPFRGAWQQDALRPADADAVLGEIAAQAAHLAQLDIATTAAMTAGATALASIGDVVEHWTQHAEHQHQDKQHTQHLLDDVPEPGLGVERNAKFFVAILRCERGVDHADTVTPAGIEAHGVLHQASKARQFSSSPRHGADFAGLGINFSLVIQHHSHRQAFQPALLLLGVTDRTIQLEVAGRLLALV